MTNPDGLWWFSTEQMTVGVVVEQGLIVEAAPIVQNFVGQPVMNLARWMQKQPGFQSALADPRPVGASE